jgi:TRAP-type C4-dicarboxylate transport system permease small subunit
LAAIAGSALLGAIALLACASIALRATGFEPILGDYEVVQLGLATSVAWLLPWCQLQGGNITVDFFTARMRARWQRRLDSCGALLFAAVMLLIAWRTAIGALSLKSSGDTTPLLGVALWWCYAAMAPGFALTAVAGVYSAIAAWVQSGDE